MTDQTIANISQFEALQDNANAQMGVPQSGMAVFNATPEQEKEFKFLKKEVADIQAKAKQVQTQREATLKLAQALNKKIDALIHSANETEFRQQCREIQPSSNRNTPISDLESSLSVR